MKEGCSLFGISEICQCQMLSMLDVINHEAILFGVKPRDTLICLSFFLDEGRKQGIWFSVFE